MAKRPESHTGDFDVLNLEQRILILYQQLIPRFPLHFSYLLDGSILVFLSCLLPGYPVIPLKQEENENEKEEAFTGEAKTLRTSKTRKKRNP